MFFFLYFVPRSIPVLLIIRKKKRNFISVASYDMTISMAQILTRIFTIVFFYYHYFTFYNLY